MDNSAPVVRINEIVCVEAFDVDVLVSVANRLQEFVVFEPGNEVTDISCSSGVYSYEESLQRLVELMRQDVDTTVIGIVGITCVDMGVPTSHACDIQEKCVLVCDHRWPAELDERDWLFCWIHMLLRSAATLICGRCCIQSNCICHVLEHMSGRELLTVNICRDCRELIADRFELRVLRRMEAAIERLRLLHVDGCILDRLHERGTEHVQAISTVPYTLKVDESWVRDYLYTRLGQNETRAGVFSSLSCRICEWGLQQCSHPVWAVVISNAVTRSRQVDTLLYLTRKRHRDHSRHQSYVAALGLFLLGSQIGYGDSLGDTIIRTLDTKYRGLGGDVRKWDEQMLLCAWIVAALLHDSGYPLAHLLETVVNFCGTESGSSSMDFGLIESILHKTALYTAWSSGWVRSVSDRVCSGCGPSYAASMGELKNHLLTSLSVAFSNCDGESLPLSMVSTGIDESSMGELAFDHGLWSAANLVDMLNESKVDAYDPVLLEALEAIAVHNLPKDGMSANLRSISFERNPLACLLRLCDEVQEWNRGTLSRGKFRYEVDHVIISPVAQIGARTYLERAINIGFVCRRGGELLEGDWDTQRFVESKKHLSPSGFPLTVSLNLTLPL